MLQRPLVVLVLLSFGTSGVVAQQSACHPDVRATDGGARCLSLIRQKALDTSAFNTVCLPEVSDEDGCRTDSLAPNQPNSLSMLAFGTPCSVDPLSGLDRYLNVTYTSPPGNYIGCDYRYESHDVAKYEVDPLSDTAVGGWIVRQMPSVSWPADTNELFTLLFLNFDRNVIHMGFANIKGNDISNALLLRPYDGSNARWVDPLVFGFLLYKQRGGLIVSDPLPLAFNLNNFVQTHDLEGPVGVNWVVLDADADSVERMNSFYTQQHCPMLIQRALEKNSPDLPFLAPPYDLKVHLRVRFTTDDFTYKCGPLEVTHPGNDFFLDPIGNPILYGGDVGKESTITVSMEMYKMFPNNTIDFAGKLYTLIITDVGYLHGLAINIHGDDVTSGTAILHYRQPLPPSVHTYYFLLYEQKAEISVPATTGFTHTTCPSDRCLDGVVQAFISVNELQLVGATWMRVDNDDYIQCQRDA